MKLLEDRIIHEGQLQTGNVLNVASFLNHQMDVALFAEMAKEWKHRFEGENINKIMTIEASGIGLATIVAQYFNVPLVFAKKDSAIAIAGEVYTTAVHSYTHGRSYDIVISKRFLTPADRLLLIDDFLASGAALLGLISLAESANATIVGAGVAIEKGFQEGGRIIRGKGIRVASLAVIETMDAASNTIIFGKR